MNGMRKVVFLFGAMMLAAFAMPAAAQKVYTLNLSPTSLTAGSSGVALAATMSNISPDNGNSSVKSFKLFAPAGGGITITAPASGDLVPLGGGYTATIQNNGSSIYVSNIQVPLKPFGPALVLNMTVNVACTATGGDWTTKATPTGVYQVWNGSSFSGQTFTQQSPSVLTTSVTGVCGSISFVNQPATTFAGYPITTTAYNNPPGAPVTVSLAINGSPAANGTQVTLSVNAGACSILSGNSASTSAGVATFDQLKMTAGTSCRLTASGGGVGPSAPSTAFNIVDKAGTLSCAPTAVHDGNLDPDAVPPLGAFDWGLLRGLNTDGTCGDDVPYTFILDPTNRTVTFTEDSLGQPTSVEYIIRWPTVSVDADGWSGKQPCVSWGVTNPVYQADSNGVCFGDYVPALACLVDDVDGPGDGTQVMPTIPSIYPYLGGESQYTPGNNAKLCVAQQGWTSSGGTVQYWTKLIDQTDSTVKLP